MKLSEILDVAVSPLQREFDHVISVVDRLHQFPSRGAIPVVVTKSTKADGVYHSLENPSRAVKMDVSIFAPHPGLTLLHEVGHFLDHQPLNLIKRGYASEFDASFEPLWELWRNSELVRKLSTLRSRKRPALSATARRFLTYQLLPIEVWARTYVQWIVTQSGDLLLESQLRSSQYQGMADPENIAEYYWDEEDFKGIMQAVDTLMKKAGLL